MDELTFDGGFCWIALLLLLRALRECELRRGERERCEPREMVWRRRGVLMVLRGGG